MFRIAAFILLLFALAFGFAWLADNPGTVTVQWDWLNEGEAYEFNLITLIVVLGALFLTSIFIWWCFFSIINSPKAFGRWRTGRRRDRGYAALSKGLVAAGAGNIPLAKQLAKESGKFLQEEPLVAMLEAQTALLEEDRPTARKQFNSMLENDETRLLGLRGLYLEAEQEGAVEAASHFAKQANDMAPGTPWSAAAVLKVQTISGQWKDALLTLDQNRSTGSFSKADYDRKRAVILTALAQEMEDAEPEQARIHGLAACKLAVDLVPAALVSARLLVRLNDVRKAGKILEANWRSNPHPEIAEAHVNLNAGDSATQRLARAKGLVSKTPDGVEALFALAKAGLDAGEFKQARSAMENVLREAPTERACLLLADIEQAEYGDRGRVREWLSRAVSASRDSTWIADGVVSDDWLPCSPVTGRLDAFEWKAPAQQKGAITSNSDDLILLASELPDEPQAVETVDVKPIPVVADTTTEAATESVKKTPADSVKDTPKKAIPENDNVSTDKVGEDHKEPVQTSAGKPSKAATSNKKKKKVKAKSSGSKSASTTPPADSSPYQQTDLDQDQDGVIDHLPDDPGVGEEEEQKKGWLF